MNARSWFLSCTAAALLGAAGAAVADDAGAVRTHNLEVVERLAALERIDVTAEKPPSEQAEPLDAELTAILEAVQALEQEALDATGTR